MTNLIKALQPNRPEGGRKIQKIKETKGTLQNYNHNQSLRQRTEKP
jgi:hypothetical protein